MERKKINIKQDIIIYERKREKILNRLNYVKMKMNKMSNMNFCFMYIRNVVCRRVEIVDDAASSSTYYCKPNTRTDYTKNKPGKYFLA